MTRQGKASAIQAILKQLYPDAQVPLTHRDPFTLLVAVILSAQCTDVKVNKVTPALFRVADTPAAMAALPRTRIETLIHPCGLAPTKSGHLKELSRILCEKYAGRVPDTFAELEALPGVGHKTASVLMAQAFGKPAFPVDTHIHRLAWRWGLSDGTRVEKTEADLKRVFPEAEWHALHLQIIFYGREYCPARGHSLEHCRICRQFGIKARLNPSP
jgi:endonuclease-3